MVWNNGQLAIDAARHNQLDRRENGVIDYDPSTHSEGEGPLAVYEGNSTTSVELRVRGGSASVGGVRAEHEPGPVGLEDGPSGKWRVVLIYVAEDGSIQTQPGTPGDNTLRIIPQNPETAEVATPDGGTAEVLTSNAIEEIRPEGPGAPVPEAYPANGLNGTILAAVWVPPEASTSSDIPQNYIQDRRRPALRQPNEGWETAALTTEFKQYDSHARRSWPIVVRGGESFKFYGFAASQIKNGAHSFSAEDFKFQIVDFETDTQEVLWEASSSPQGDPQSGPLETFDVPEDDPPHGYAFRVRNETSTTYLNTPDLIAIQGYWTIEPTTRF